MSVDIVNTGNIVADNLIRKQVSDDVFSLAIISYLEQKGLLDRDEFWEIFNIECKLFVHAINKVEQNYSIGEDESNL